MKIPWNSCKTWRKNYKNFRQIICKQQAKPRNIYMWWSRKFIKSKEKFVWCILQKLNIIELYLAEGYSILRFLWYLTVVRFLWNIVSAKRTQEKKNNIWQEMSPEFFCKPNFRISYLTDEHVFKSTSTWYQMLVVKEPNKKKSKWFSSVLHGDQKYFEKMYIFVIPNDAIQYVYKKIAFKFIMK